MKQNKIIKSIVDINYSVLINSLCKPVKTVCISKRVREDVQKSQEMLRNFEKKIERRSEMSHHGSQFNINKHNNPTFYKEKLQKFTQINDMDKLQRQQIDINRFKINKTDDQQYDQMKMLLSEYITNNRKFYNSEVVKIQNYEQKAPFFVESFSFADRFLDQKLVVNKQFGFDEKNLQRNNLTLEKIVLERLLKQKKLNDRERIYSQYIPSKKSQMESEF